jgi:chorismate-pyruvate lyase
VMDGIYRVKNHQFLTNNDIFKLEAISHKKFDLVQRILLIDLGNTQQLLEVINNTKTAIRVIEQTEEKNIISRKSCIISSTNDILASANSKIYCRKMPIHVLSEIRDCKKGIGKILLYHRLEIFKKITEIGYVEGLHIFKNYSLYHKKNVICRINEVFPLKINK